MTGFADGGPLDALRLRPGAPRPRRLRRTPALRDLVRETTLDPSDLVFPLFVVEGRERTSITSMPGIDQLPLDALAEEAGELADLGIQAVLLFGLPAAKDPLGAESHAEDGIVQQAIRLLKASSPELVVMTDVCLCEYTDHGHCGVLDADGYLLNDETLEILGRIAVSHGEAGADVVAPSGMIDGMVGAIRAALDAEDGLERVAILSYAVKYASAFYGPFREAAEGAPAFGDRKSHQLDVANAREAMREATLDVEEGADALLVKPALGYLDVVRRVHERFPELPLAAYNVSGEYSMVKAAAANGWIDECEIVLEILTSIRRAGADLVVTYHAKEAAAWLRELA